MRKNNVQNNGFSLMEIIIATGIIAIIGGLMTGILLTTTQIQLRESASTEITGQLNFVIQTIQRLVRESSNIEMEVGITTSTLKLRMAGSSKDPTCISLVNGVIKLAEGPVAGNPNNCTLITSDLTSNRVIVNSLNFKKFTQYPGHDTVSIEIAMTYNTQDPRIQVQRTLTSAIARVSAATFDSNVVPGGTYNYTLGQVGAPWQRVIVADGSATNPSYTFANNTGLGLFRADTNILGFATAGAERMRINASGNVGIGTTSPASLLDVTGGLTTVGAVLTLGTKELTVVANDVLGRINFYAPLESDGGDSRLVGASIAAIAEDTFSTTVNKTSLAFQTGASETATTKMTIMSNGNVGIGTTNPMAKQDVVWNNAASAMPAIRIASTTASSYTSADNGAFLNFQNANGRFDISRGWHMTEGIQYYSHTATGEAIQMGSGIISFWQGTGLTAGGNSNLTERMRIHSDGNVGIGTTAPGALLHTVKLWSGSNLGTVNNTIIRSQLGNSGASVGATTLKGLKVLAGMNWGSGGTAHGIQVTPQIGQYQGLGTYIGLYLTNPVDNNEGESPGSITTNYGIYQEHSSALNYFAGKVGIGTTNLQTKLDVINKVHDATIPTTYVSSITNAHNAEGKYGLIVGTNWASTENFVASFGNYAAVGGAFTSYLAIKGDGAVYMKSLGGSGNVYVYADNSGQLLKNGAYSDIKLKKDIIPISEKINISEAIRNIKGIYYHWDTSQELLKNYDNEWHVGVLAQELEKYVPELTTTDSNGYKGVNYPFLTAFLMEAVRVQQQQIDSLQEQVNQLK